MYVLIDTVNNEFDLQPLETVISCDFSISLDTLQIKLNQIIENIESINSDNKFLDDMSTHTLRIFKIKDNTSMGFNVMTSQYQFNDLPIIENSYQSCDF
jgi:hypothetical protein